MPELFSIKEIDAMKGIVTPHERDLEDIGKKNVDTFIKFKNPEDVNRISKKINAIVENADMGEEWMIVKEIFPEVKIHILFQDYGEEDEPGMGDQYEVQFYFSGDRVKMISGEDLSHLCEAITDYMSLLFLNKSFPQTFSGEPSRMLQTALKERVEPFVIINEMENSQKHFDKMARFIGGRNMISKGDAIFRFHVSLFPDLDLQYWVEKINNKWELKYELTGDAVKILPVYDTERLIIMAINQAIRYIKEQLKEKAPRICDVMFSGFYKKEHADLF